MAIEKKVSSRIIHKHDTAANWELAAKNSNFTPMQGELIVYDIDDTCSFERFKIGDGKTLVTNLPFYFEDQWNEIESKLLDVTVDNQTLIFLKGENK